MNADQSMRRAQVRAHDEQGATFVELFFDLVFVYAITQLTSLVLHDLTWPGVGRAAVLFWLVWWAWTQFTWTLNLADTEHAWIRIPTLIATGAAFFLAQAVPDAFGSAGLWFAISYALARVIGILVQTWVVRGGEGAGTATDDKALAIFVGVSNVGIVLVLVGGLLEGDGRLWVWTAAVVADLVTVAFAGRGRWELAAGHFAERHGLIVIIALGESLIAAGVATAELPRDAVFLVTTAGAVAGACALWWTYFGVLHARFEHQLAAQGDATRARFARDVFSLGHAVVVAGVIGIAVGFESAIAHPADPLAGAAGLALTLGVLGFIGGVTFAAARAGLRAAIGPRLAVVAMVIAATPLIPRVAAPVTLWALAALVTGLAAWETRHLGRVDTERVPG